MHGVSDGLADMQLCMAVLAQTDRNEALELGTLQMLDGDAAALPWHCAIAAMCMYESRRERNDRGRALGFILENLKEAQQMQTHPDGEVATAHSDCK